MIDLTSRFYVLILRFDDVGMTLKNLLRRVTWANATTTERVVYAIDQVSIIVRMDSILAVSLGY